MCLTTRYDKDKKKDFLATIPKEGLTVYKIVGIGRNKYFPMTQRTDKPYEDGVLEADTSVVVEMSRFGSYKSGFHFTVNREDAENDLMYIHRALADKLKYCRKRARDLGQKLRKNYVIIECVVKKSWITSVGTDGMRVNDRNETIVAKKAIFPKFSRK